MQNSENYKKKKIPLYPKFKTTSTFKKNRENAIIWDSSDDSNILEDSSDFEINEDLFNKKIQMSVIKFKPERLKT
jgi:hypothetical protein